MTGLESMGDVSRCHL